LLDFKPLRNVPDVKITLRADTSTRAVAQLPPSLSCVSGLTDLTVQVGLAVTLSHCLVNSELEHT
jgi:hypothetical protein